MRHQLRISTILLLICASLAALSAFAASVRLTVFDCGSIQMSDVNQFSLTNEETTVRELFVPCYLIEHPEGRLVWDAGLPLEYVGRDSFEPQPGMSFSYAVSFLDQLAELNLTPADIDLVAFSHMHFDHVGAANQFQSAKLLIQDTEYQAAFVDKNNPYFQVDLYEGLSGNEKEVLSGDHDIFADGSVVIVSAPGHTPGHQVLLIRLDNFGPLILSGDLYHFRKSRELKRAPVFNTDAQQTFDSMDKVEALIKSEGATFWIEHDKALADTLELAPAYYD